MDWNGLLDGMTDIVRDTFGQAVSYSRFETGITYPNIEAIFDPSFETTEVGGSVPVTIRIPVLDIKLSDIGGLEPKQDDQAVINATTYRVIKALPSSSGMMKAHLRKM